MRAHRPALDGVRGLAILFVLLFHATHAEELPAGLHQWFAWGWMGVDVFFVLSGFLITGVLMDSAQADHGYYRAFYGRRFLRIVPAYALYLLAVTVLAIVQRATGPAQTFLHHEVWYWVYLTNVAIAWGGLAATPFMTGHLWSLAVEEQFYLVWPWVIKRRVTPTLVAGIAVWLLILIPVFRASLQPHVRADALYVLTIFRADAFAVGALLAAVERTPFGDIELESYRPWLIAGGVMALALTFYAEHGFTPNPTTRLGAAMTYLTPALFSGALLTYAAHPEAPHWLSWRWLRVLGKYSYAVYLWHILALAVAHHIPHASAVTYLAASAVLTIAPVWASWRFVERKALALKRYIPMPHASTTPAPGRPWANVTRAETSAELAHASVLPTTTALMFDAMNPLPPAK